MFCKTGDPSCGASGAPQDQAIAFTRAFRRDSLREAVPFLTTPLLTLLSSSGCASLIAACAAALSTPEMAVSTFFTARRATVRRARLTYVRFLVWRARFPADYM